MEFFCGSGPECQTATNQADEEQFKTRMLEKVLSNLYLIYNPIGKTTCTERLLCDWRFGAVRRFASSF